MSGSRSDRAKDDSNNVQPNDDGLNLPYPPRASTPEGKGDKGKSPLTMKHRRVSSMPGLTIPPLIISNTPLEPDTPSDNENLGGNFSYDVSDIGSDRVDSELVETSYDRNIRSFVGEVSPLSPSDKSGSQNEMLTRESQAAATKEGKQLLPSTSRDVKVSSPGNVGISNPEKIVTDKDVAGLSGSNILTSRINEKNARGIVPAEIPGAVPEKIDVKAFAIKARDVNAAETPPTSGVIAEKKDVKTVAKEPKVVNAAEALPKMAATGSARASVAGKIKQEPIVESQKVRPKVVLAFNAPANKLPWYKRFFSACFSTEDNKKDKNIQVQIKYKK